MKGSLIACLLILACSNKKEIEFKKVDAGLQYKAFNTGSGDVAEPGQYLKMHVKQYYNDSLLSDTDSTLPQYQLLDSTQLSKQSFAIFSKVKVGDSLVFKVPADSAFKTKRPAFTKKAGWLYTHVKIEGIMSETEARADLNMEKARKRKAN